MKQLFAGMLMVFAACGDSSSSSVDSSTGATDGTTPTIDASSGVDCSTATTTMDKAVCQANGFLATLSTADAATANPAFTDVVSRTKWSNLPGTARAGVKMGSISATSQAAALELIATVLTTAGTSDLTGVRNADDYLGAQSSGGGGGGGGGGGSTYAATNYYIAVIGTPSSTGNWAIMFGGHHMAYNITFTNGVGYPTPNHLGVEPKAAFTVNNATWQPMADEGSAMLAVFQSLSSSQLSSAYLANQTFADVLIGPVEYGTGTSAAAKAKFPAGANRTGVLVSSLSSTQQALVTTAIEQWVADYDTSISASLLTAYTDVTAYANTLVAWGGTQSSGVDVDVNGTYMRIDGPRVWIEVSCQAGVVIQGITHYHSIYRDKTFDYANTL